MRVLGVRISEFAKNHTIYFPTARTVEFPSLKKEKIESLKSQKRGKSANEQKNLETQPK